MNLNNNLNLNLNLNNNNECKYKLEGNIDFYSELYKSLEEENSLDDTNLCQITGLKLVDKFVTLQCNHHFNYDAIYTEICKQKFEFKTYNSESLLPNDLKLWRKSGCNYYIKCPYCRNIQFDLLPYYEDLPFIKKYGVNTDDVEYRVVDNMSHIAHQMHNSGSYVYKVYGYVFKKGGCDKIIVNSSGKHLPCYNSFVCKVDGLEKSFCPCHIRDAVKEYKLQLKLKAGEEKQKMKEEKQKEKDLAKALKAENVVVSKTNKISAFNPKGEAGPTGKAESGPTGKVTGKAESEGKAAVLCVAILKTGARKGDECGLRAFNTETSLCKRHSKYVCICIAVKI